MRKYLSIILFISVGLGQDVLTTKKGIEYKGKMIEAGYDEVKFIREELPNPQNVKTEIIQSLILSDGTEIVKNGILIRDSFVKEESSNSLNQAVIGEEAISDAKISIFNKHNISVGMLDDRTGLSLLGYTYNIKQTTMDEYFIGAGTVLSAFTGTVGWKHYYKKSRLSISSVLCGQYLAHQLDYTRFVPTVSFTIEYDIVEWAQVKLGAMGLMLLGGTSGEEGSGAGVLPFLGLNFFD